AVRQSGRAADRHQESQHPAHDNRPPRMAAPRDRSQGFAIAALGWRSLTGERPMLKLAKLPDRTPVKIAITVTPDLAHTLADYAAIYNRAYADKAAVADLIPAMLETFLASDRAFAKAR